MKNRSFAEQMDTPAPPQPDQPVLRMPKIRVRRRRRPYLSARKIILWSFLIPVIILALAFAANRFFPFGDSSPLTIDLYHQYAHFWWN